MLGVGDVAKNKEAIGLAVKKLGMRPSQGMVEQAVWQFFSLCLPKNQEVCSRLVSKGTGIDFNTHAFSSSMHARKKDPFRYQAQDAVACCEAAALQIFTDREDAWLGCMFTETSKGFVLLFFQACMIEAAPYPQRW